jgi:polyhydroxyalkanoate synthesis regulator phasin
MANSLENLLYSVVGTATIAADKVKELLEDLLQNNDYTQDEGRRVVKTLLHQVEDTKLALNNKIYVLVDDILLKFNLPTQDKLKNGVEDLKEKVQKPFAGKKRKGGSLTTR